MMQISPDTNRAVHELKQAIHEVLDVYARLRQAASMQEKTSLLRQARDRASVITESLQALASGMHALDSNALRTLKEIGPLMEQLLVQEREYRHATAGSAEDTNHAGAAS